MVPEDRQRKPIRSLEKSPDHRCRPYTSISLFDLVDHSLLNRILMSATSCLGDEVLRIS